MKDRKKWIDILRAISMILVVFGHSVPQRAWFFHVVTPLKIPMFFAITGYVFNDCDGKIGKFLKKILFRLVIPWISLGVILQIPALVTGGIGAFGRKCLGVLDGKLFWYMPCCIIAEIIWFFALKATKKWQYLTALSACLFAGGYLLNTYAPELLIVNCALTCILYVSFGYAYKMLEEKIRKIKHCVIAAFALLYISVTTLSFFFNDRRSMDVHILKYPHLWYAIPTIALGIFVMFSVFGRLRLDNERLFSFIGKNTLVIYLTHGAFLEVFAKLLKIAELTKMNIWIRGPLATVFALAGTLVLAMIIDKICPVLSGKGKQNITKCDKRGKLK